MKVLKFKNGKTENIKVYRPYSSGKTFIETCSGQYLYVEYLVVKPIQHIGSKFFKYNPMAGKYQEVSDVIGFEYAQS